MQTKITPIVIGQRPDESYADFMRRMARLDTAAHLNASFAEKKAQIEREDAYTLGLQYGRSDGHAEGYHEGVKAGHLQGYWWGFVCGGCTAALGAAIAALVFGRQFGALGRQIVNILGA